MGQNIRTTLSAHAQWLTLVQFGELHARTESDHCVLSYSPPCVNVPTSHSCLFSSIIDGAQQLTATFTTAAISLEKCGGLDIDKAQQESKSNLE